MRNVPTQTPLVDQGGRLSQLWTQFFSLLAKDVAGWQPPSMADANAPNGTVYYSTTGAKLSFKDYSGVVRALY